MKNWETQKIDVNGNKSKMHKFQAKSIEAAKIKATKIFGPIYSGRIEISCENGEYLEKWGITNSWVEI